MNDKLDRLISEIQNRINKNVKRRNRFYTSKTQSTYYHQLVERVHQQKEFLQQLKDLRDE